MNKTLTEIEEFTVSLDLVKDHNFMRVATLLNEHLEMIKMAESYNSRQVTKNAYCPECDTLMVENGNCYLCHNCGNSVSRADLGF